MAAHTTRGMQSCSSHCAVLYGAVHSQILRKHIILCCTENCLLFQPRQHHPLEQTAGGTPHPTDFLHNLCLIPATPCAQNPEITALGNMRGQPGSLLPCSQHPSHLFKRLEHTNGASLVSATNLLLSTSQGSASPSLTLSQSWGLPGSPMDPSQPFPMCCFPSASSHTHTLPVPALHQEQAAVPRKHLPVTLSTPGSRWLLDGAQHSQDTCQHPRD